MIYFSSDHHFWHSRVIEYCKRPFSTTEEMNEKLIVFWNNTVSSTDTVYYLGDFSLACRPVETITQRLNGIKKLIPGNHDWVFPNHKKYKKNPLRWSEYYTQSGWEVLPFSGTTLDIDGFGTVNMCHLPYENDVPVENDKYAKWRLKDDGRWLLCGHVHEKWKIKKRMINVGCDVWDFRPVSIEEIKKIIIAKP